MFDTYVPEPCEVNREIKCDCGKRITLHGYEGFIPKGWNDTVWLGHCYNCMSIWSRKGNQEPEEIGRIRDWDSYSACVRLLL